jgi:hypothetical protein
MEKLENILVNSLYIWNGHGRIIFTVFLTFLNLWIFVLLIFNGGYLLYMCTRVALFCTH